MSSSGENGEVDDGIPSMANQSLLRDLPTTARGLRTRSALIAAARTVFERDGFLDARLADISAEAQCSAGTFYTYFSSKDEIFAAVLAVAQEEMLHPGMAHVAGADNPVAIIDASNRAYFESYRRNAKLMALLEQVSHVDPQFRELRQKRTDAFVQRNARSIESLQKRGLVDPAMDPLFASRALSSMTSRLAYGYFCNVDSAEITEDDMDLLTRNTTRIWTNALRIES
ncbi:TetR/AcrR family transcriptional regulator [Gordonia hydrophobica]|uniref:TetR/AcrR family transcriptional regulator n=1 Tax=Gordonia hydrophobica TaxID=40516 RepID=A0ABZ2U5I5_9ACTN|nr:TetR/AcrR family transcriptional regulator [Gordonia hydrophobica]MBM7368642.1 AcrR family transcriptional regulator [Gordonia hydrophobica]